MSKIFFNDEEIWSKPYLPKEDKVRMLFRKYAPSQVGNELAIEAMTLGLDVNSKEGYFQVELSRDRLVIPGRMRKNERTA